MEKIKGVVKRIPSFSGLSDGEIEDIIKIAVHKEYAKGDMIFFEGDEGNGFYVIVEGMVKIFKTSTEGKEQILHVFGPGEPFGEVAVFAGQSFPANAMVLKNSKMVFFPRTSFVNLITQNPSLAMNMLAVLSMRLRQFTQQIESLALKEVPARLAGYLLYLTEEQGNKEVVTLTISKGALASFLGTIPETLSRIFARMSDQGLIAVDGKNIRLLKPDLLKDLSLEGKSGVTMLKG